MMDQVPPQPTVTPVPSIIPIVQPLPSKSKIWLWILTGVVLLGVGIVCGIFLGKQLYSTSTSQPTPSPVTKATPSPDATANWKTYMNNFGNYEIKYPLNFSRMVCPNEENQIYLVQSGVTGEDPIIAPTCGRDSRYPVEIITSTDPIIPYDDRYNVTTEITSTAGIQAKKYTSTQKPNFEGPGESWYIDVIFTSGGKYYDIYTHNKDFLATFGQILSTFKFLDQNSDPEGKFCGGIAANLPQNQCPEGYTCKLENNYPDAGGVCIKKFESGTLEAKVVRSPTCAGPITGQKNCEGPYADGTFKIMSLPGNEDIQTIRTDKNGAFTTSLNPGTYDLQNAESGIGKNIRNPGFTIAGGKTTIQRFDVDTGIR